MGNHALTDETDFPRSGRVTRARVTATLRTWETKEMGTNENNIIQVVEGITEESFVDEAEFCRETGCAEMADRRRQGFYVRALYLCRHGSGAECARKCKVEMHLALSCISLSEMLKVTIAVMGSAAGYLEEIR